MFNVSDTYAIFFECIGDQTGFWFVCCKHFITNRFHNVRLNNYTHYMNASKIFTC